MEKTLEYYFEDGTHVIFDKYTIDASGVIRNKKTGVLLHIRDNKTGYKSVLVTSNGGSRRGLLIGRAIASTFHRKPLTMKHTADHIDQDPTNNIVDNIRWLCKKGQIDNRTMPENYKSAFIVVNNGIEKTANEWVDHLKDDKNHMGRKYTARMITKYAQQKQYGFSYKKYQDLPGEVWKQITWSKTNLGRWEISNMNRVKWITTHVENVFSGERLGTRGGYPTIWIKEKHWSCHILAFMAFFPEEYATKKSDEMILHEDDNKLDFRPYKLRLGTRSENARDAHSNGKYDGTLRARMKCSSYINDVLEKDHESQIDAKRYLMSLGYEKASCGNINSALHGTRETAYGRTWKLST